LNRFVAIFGKKYGSFSPKIVGRKKVVKTGFGYFKTKKVPTAVKLGGRGG